MAKSDTINEEEEVKDEIIEKIPVDETPTPPTAETPEEPKEELDVDKLKEEIREDVAKELSKTQANKIYKALTGEDEPAPEQEKDRYQEFATKFYQENGRNPYWHELIPEVVKATKEEMAYEQAEQAKQTEEQRKAIEEDNKKRVDEFNRFTDEQLDDLYTANKLPQIVDKDDPEDYGVKARQALFKTMMEVNQKRTAEGKAPIYSIKEIYYEHYQVPSRQPAGYDAPVSVGRGGTPPTNSQEIDYFRDIRNARSFEDILRNG